MPMIDIKIDGRYGEGGRALLHTALVLSSLTQQPFLIEHIRGRHRKPGIAPEDLLLIRTLASLTSAEVAGDALRSDKLFFKPKEFSTSLVQELNLYSLEKKAGEGNVISVLEALLPIACKAGRYFQVVAKGNNYFRDQCTLTYFENVLLKTFKDLGIYANASLRGVGLGRSRLGEIWFEVEPSVIQGFCYEDRGELKEVKIILTYSALDEKRLGEALCQIVASLGLSESALGIEKIPVAGQKAWMSACVVGHFERGRGAGLSMEMYPKDYQKLLESAVSCYFEWERKGACFDSYLGARLLLPAVFGSGETAFTVSMLSEELKTVIWVIKQFLPAKITVLDQKPEIFKILITH